VQVERTGLRRDVAGGEAQPEEGLEVLAPVLGHDRAVPGRVEAVDHHAVEAGEGAHLGGQGGAQGVERGRRLQPLEGQRQAAVPHRVGLPRVVQRLELDDEQAVRAVRDQVDLAARRRRCAAGSAPPGRRRPAARRRPPRAARPAGHPPPHGRSARRRWPRPPRPPGPAR
jgi:hypothetical protein